ncbi:ABC transporter permease [Paramesorhizobium deserti]|uniref:ABC transporter permease n=1 Tax=Paramesorhizobium deserti TaxID=1494590 RepID=A0A135I1V7_9HYPH|nr:ABC transporter permease [Paramesorhizobium deserti]KXF79426.1 ABC transporter permease [Paramesorhizobium deserti]
MSNSQLARSIAKLAAALSIGSILFFLVLPTLLIIPMSLSQTDYIRFPPDGLTLRWYVAYFSDPDWMAATWFSLKIALATTVSATIIGTMAALALVRGDLPCRNALQALSLGPMIVPHIVLGVALYLVFSPLQLTGSFTGFLIAHTVLAVPYVLITVIAALQRLDPMLELAALNCGASRLQSFFRIMLPNIAPGIASGSAFAFLASFDEATVAFFISDIGGKSIGRKMFEDIDFNLTPVIAAASAFMVAISIGLMCLAHTLTQARTQR